MPIASPNRLKSAFSISIAVLSARAVRAASLLRSVVSFTTTVFASPELSARNSGGRVRSHWARLDFDVTGRFARARAQRADTDKASQEN